MMSFESLKQAYFDIAVRGKQYFQELNVRLEAENCILSLVGDSELAWALLYVLRDLSKMTPTPYLYWLGEAELKLFQGEDIHSVLEHFDTLYFNLADCREVEKAILYSKEIREKHMVMKHHLPDRKEE